jgi:GNAT superfamily N-acetyltransferase
MATAPTLYIIHDSETVRNHFSKDAIVDAISDVIGTADLYNIRQETRIEAPSLGGEDMWAVGYSQEAVEQSENALATVYLDGTPVNVREVQKSDVVLIHEMHQRLSKESVYLRYLAPRMPDPEYVQRLCFFGGRPGLALVATVQEPRKRVIAMACYVVQPDDPYTAEPAIVVEDRYQGRGLGKRMLLALCQQARLMGLHSFVCFTHGANDCVLHLIKASGLSYESSYSKGVREFRVWLEPH